jgi:hypothetical protein
MHIMINFLFWSMAINLTSFLVDNRNKIHYVKLYISNRLNWKWRPRWITETKLVNNMHSYTSLNLIKQNNQKNMLNHSQKNVPYFMSDSHCRTDHYIVFSISQHEWTLWTTNPFQIQSHWVHKNTLNIKNKNKKTSSMYVILLWTEDCELIFQQDLVIDNTIRKK